MNHRSVLLLCSICLCISAAMAEATNHSGVYNVDKYGAKGDGKVDDSKAFMAAWAAACADTGSPTVEIPQKVYLVGPLRLVGWCKNTGIFTMKVDGVVKAQANMSSLTREWILFGYLKHFKLTGKGTFDGQGEAAWALNQCHFKNKCQLLPVSLKLVYMENTRVDGITSLNPKFFHMALLNNTDFVIQNVTFTAPKDSPNTDGIHLESCLGVKILQCKIGTGDDCISIGQGNTDVYLNGILCGPGHGISVGSLGKYPTEKDVNGLVVTGCTFTNTTNGVRIKSWRASPLSTSAKNMTFDNLIAYDVANPIIIDQNYCPYQSGCPLLSPSGVALSDINFNNIRGTSTTEVAVNLKCSAKYPCKNIKIQDINLRYKGEKPAISDCANVIQASYKGKQFPSPCQ